MKGVMWVVYLLIFFAILTALPPSPSWGPLKKRQQKKDKDTFDQNALKILSEMDFNWVTAKPRIERGVNFSGDIANFSTEERALLEKYYSNPCLDTAAELFSSNPKRWFANYTIYGPEPDSNS